MLQVAGLGRDQYLKSTVSTEFKLVHTVMKLRILVLGLVWDS